MKKVLIIFSLILLLNTGECQEIKDFIGKYQMTEAEKDGVTYNTSGWRLIINEDFSYELTGYEQYGTWDTIKMDELLKLMGEDPYKDVDVNTFTFATVLKLIPFKVKNKQIISYYNYSDGELSLILSENNGEFSFPSMRMVFNKIQKSK